LLLLTASGLLAGCSRTHEPRSAPSPPGKVDTERTAPPAPSGALPPVRPWRPDRSDLDPLAKLTAVRLIERYGTGRRSTVEVADAQYGGLLAGSASVLVVTRSWHLDRQGRVRTGGATYDVRVARTGRTRPRWQVTAVHPSRPGPPARQVSAAAHEVLAHPRIELPPAAHADLLSGHIHDSVLTAMLALAQRHRIGVSVVRSGHPLLVFGTDRPSDHPRGRAFDTWRIDGHEVVDAATPRRLVTSYMEAAAAAGSYNVGGPYLLGAAPQFFSDRTHHDHVHAGFAT
jgi:hypothetical protein